MIKLKSLLTEEVKKISLQQAIDKRFFGPVYHGTSEDRRDKINVDGFKIFHGDNRSGDISNGYETSDYFGGMPAPIHHLGYGIYFTTVKTIAKKFSGGTMRGMQTYYIDVNRLETINFAAPRTMMKWWIANGYDYKLTDDTKFGGSRTEWGGVRNTLPAIQRERVRATMNLTNNLKSKYDAVWFKGKTMFSVLDGDQVCVYDPSNIYQLDNSLTIQGEIGSKVVSKIGIDPYNRGTIAIPIGTKGIIVGKRDAEEMRKQYPLATWTEDAKYILDVKWEKGGRFSVLDKWVEPYTKK